MALRSILVVGAMIDDPFIEIQLYLVIRGVFGSAFDNTLHSVLDVLLRLIQGVALIGEAQRHLKTVTEGCVLIARAVAEPEHLGVILLIRLHNIEKLIAVIQRQRKALTVVALNIFVQHLIRLFHRIVETLIAILIGYVLSLLCLG